MSADRLREAARVLRERAEAATPGEWGRPGEHIIVAHPENLIVAEVPRPATAEYIATMHPGVALALADWLDDMGRSVHGTSRGDVPFEDHADRITDLILGGAA